ncbi:sacsin N-terminal ATP-binding-like domain-containing protein [Spirillospora sp. CA-294931]|uniref:sacsin N-terminal ATP-binding-like domain-containing protein n=1 Tax=Spirillospora sp. CA-294931 TaxID=3240042 RepID=UPI003D92237C
MLRGWAESVARFREDANAEEDLVLGGYRDRVVVELAQNAADAAVRGGVSGRVRFSLRGTVLSAANTGAALDAGGVEALSTLRASGKRDEDGAVGRFGVGFAAVVAVSDEPSIGSGGGGVSWSLERARELASGVPGLGEELGRRGGHVPLLRLPFACEVEVPDGFDTVVRLPLRDADAVAAVRRQLEEAGPALMLALPALGTVEIEIDGVEVRTLTAERADGRVVIDGVPWRVVEDHGVVPPELLVDRPVEERARPYWQVRWALGESEAPRVVHAPTPSDERLDLPALLIGSFPLAPDRRHVAPGALTDFLVERAAEGYVRLMGQLAGDPAVLELVPGVVGVGELDARIRRAIVGRLPDAVLLPDGARGRDAVVVDAPAAFVGLLGTGILPGVLPARWPARHPGLNALGVRRVELADVVDALAGLEQPPLWWRELYESLTGASTDALGAIPVPLADGRTVRGPRGLLVASDLPKGLEILGLRLVDPEAAHPLLLRLGAVEAGPRAVLGDPAVREAVEGAFEADDPDEIAEAVLGLVAAAHLDPGDEPWLGELPLSGEDGDLYPAAELLLPQSPLRGLMAEDAPFGVVAEGVVERWGPETLEAAGVLGGFALVRAEDVNLPALADGVESQDLADEELWAEDVLDRLGDQELPPVVPEFRAVRDLELVADWDAALRLLAQPPVRVALVEPVHVMLYDGRRVALPSYTAWWLRRHPVLNGRLPGEYSVPDDLLAGLYEPLPVEFDPELLLALGVRTSLDELLREPGGAQELLDRMADPARPVARDRLGALWTALAESGAEVSPPERVRAVVDGEVEVVAAEDALVLDRPDLLPLLAGQPLVIPSHELAGPLADLLDLPLASEEVPGAVESSGVPAGVPDVVGGVLPGAVVSYVAHDRLVVDGQDVPWFLGEGELHASGPEGLARGLAWLAGRWEDRFEAEAVLRSPDAAATLRAEADLDGREPRHAAGAHGSYSHF